MGPPPPPPSLLPDALVCDKQRHRARLALGQRPTGHAQGRTLNAFRPAWRGCYRRVPYDTLVFFAREWAIRYSMVLYAARWYSGHTNVSGAAYCRRRLSLMAQLTTCTSSAARGALAPWPRPATAPSHCVRVLAHTVKGLVTLGACPAMPSTHYEPTIVSYIQVSRCQASAREFTRSLRVPVRLRACVTVVACAPRAWYSRFSQGDDRTAS